MKSYSTKTYNIAIGHSALGSAVGGNLTAIGASTLPWTKKNYNTAIGYRAGYSTSPSNPENDFENITLLGANTLATQSNQVVLGDAAITSIRTMNDDYGVTVPLTNNDLITKKYADTNYAGGGGGVAWGDITGTLSAQTDLQTELDTKIGEDTTGTTSHADKIWVGTQAEYTALTPVATTVYFIL